MLEIKPWTVVDNRSQGHVALEGEPVGDELRLLFAVDWQISDSDTAIITDVGHVKCLDGASSLDPYAVIHEATIKHDQRRVTWEASVHSYRRKIPFRVGVVTGFENGSPHRAYVCEDLVLDIQPGPEPVNEPWVEPPPPVVIAPWAITCPKMDIKVDQSFSYVSEKAAYWEPFTDEITPTIERAKPFHPHATENDRPRISATLLSDGSGYELHPHNLRINTAYVVRVPNTVIYVRTVSNTE